MAGCLKVNEEDLEARRLSRKIDEQLRRDKQAVDKKLLLLGTGEAGKSTFVKQMKFLYGSGFSDEEKKEFRIDIIRNIVEGMKTLIGGMDTLNIAYEKDSSFNAYVPQILNYSLAPYQDSLDETISGYIEQLWSDSGIQACFAQRSSLQIPDSVKFFLDDIKRVTAEDFVPTDQDILLSRRQTTGVIEYKFTLESDNNFSFRLIDVGGQRGERRKWSHVFESVTALIFLVAVSEYDQVLLEDLETNRLRESKRLFRDIISDKWFKDTHIILFFNKRDLFQEKIQRVHLADFFPGFEGPKKDAKAAIDYIKGMFEQVNEDKLRKIHSFDTVAIDPDNAKNVFLSVKVIIFEKIMDGLKVVF